jgi:hypothetical protein
VKFFSCSKNDQWISEENIEIFENKYLVIRLPIRHFIAMLVKFQSNFLSILNIYHICACLLFRLVVLLAIIRHSGSSKFNKDTFNLLHTSKCSYYHNSHGKIESCDGIQLSTVNKTY